MTVPTSLWVMAGVRACSGQGIPVYVVKKGDPDRGTVILKIDTRAGIRVLYQQRDNDGALGWVDAFNGELADGIKANEYTMRAVKRDPDIWVVEVEDPAAKNPFEEKMA